MILKNKLAKEYAILACPDDMENDRQETEDSFIEGFECARKLLAEKMDKDCYDQGCGFSSIDILDFGEEEI